MVDKYKCTIYRDETNGAWGIGETKLEAKENAKAAMIKQWGNYQISKIDFEEIEESKSNGENEEKG